MEMHIQQWKRERERNFNHHRRRDRSKRNTEKGRKIPDNKDTKNRYERKNLNS